jgi:hypothetical protein
MIAVDTNVLIYACDQDRISSGPVHSSEALPAQNNRKQFSSPRYIHVTDVPAGGSGMLLELSRGRPSPASILMGPDASHGQFESGGSITTKATLSKIKRAGR